MELPKRQAEWIARPALLDNLTCASCRRGYPHFAVARCLILGSSALDLSGASMLI